MAIKFDTKSFLDILTCPVGFDPLINAVSLSPCCHKVNQVVAEKCYGKIVNGFCELKGKACVICITPVVTYAPDHAIRNLAACAFGHEKALEALPTHPLVLDSKEEQKGEVKLPYPGLPAVFVCNGDEWNNPVDYTNEIRRKVTFKSTTENSLIYAFELFGYRNGSVSILVCFRKNSSFKDYLKANQINCKKDGFYNTETQAELITLLRIIELNNKIPPEQHDQIRRIVMRGSCDPLPRNSSRNQSGTSQSSDYFSSMLQNIYQC